jgi:hypothetical protein
MYLENNGMTGGDDSESILFDQNEVRKKTVVWKDSVASMKMLLGING